MKRITYTILFSLFLLFLGSDFLLAQGTPVDQWGATNKNTGKGWPILNTASTPAGNGAMGAAGPPAGNDWATIRGGFPTIEVAAGEALVITGKIEWVGGSCGDSYIPIRYALTFQDENNTLNNPNTDSAKWSSTLGAYGYEFTPRTGIGNVANGAGGTGTVWVVKNGNWPSTNSNGGPAIANVVQVPRNAKINAGVYNFGISVQPLANGDNEVRWYLVSEDNKSYWYAGTVIDTAGVTTKFNGVCFGVTGEHIATTGIKQISLTDVRVGKGSPIVVPMPPFTAHYVEKWGATNKNTGKGWPIMNDSTTMAGNGAMGKDGPPAGNDWATIRGGFDIPAEATTSEALVVTGKIEWVGGSCGDSYIPIRYALTFQDENNKLNNQYTDSAKWSSTIGSYGYEFTPRTGIGNVANGAGGTGTVWVVKNGNWPSTNSNGGPAIANVVQVPRNAKINAGIYNFGISVQPLANGDNEVRWYLVSEDNKSYWYAGTVIDTAGVTTKFNGICFGVTGEHIATTGIKQIKLIDVYVEKGKPITVPMPPFTAHYVSQWGATNKNTGKGWPIMNDSTTMAGNGAMGADGPPAGNDWATIRGGFEVPAEATTSEALVVTGKIEWVGGSCGDSYIPIRYALTFQDENNKLNNQYTDSAKWSSTIGSYGYEFTPRTGIGNVANGAGGTGTVWVVKNGNWPSTNSNGGPAIANVVQVPRNAKINAGIYNFGISVQPLANGDNEVRWYLVSEDNKSYWYAGTVIDTAGVTTKFNGVCFGVTGEHIATTGIKQIKLIDVYVEKGKPITIPTPPFTSFYVGTWGFIGGKTGSWVLKPGDMDGNVSISGSAPVSGWAAVRGEFQGPAYPTLEKALEVKGSIKLTNGGFEDPSSLLFGIFQSSGAGKADSTAAGYEWNGSEGGNTGYLFIPQSGTNTLPTWNNTPGTVGTISNGVWMDANSAGSKVLGAKAQAPAGVVAAAGTYDFSIYVIKKQNGSQDIKYIMQNSDKSYTFANTVTDASPVTENFNSINVALNSSTAKGMELIDINVDQIDVNQVPVGVAENSELGIPTEFGLSQNYPNPFNPTTAIKFALPKASNVSLVVYDMLGRNVATLVNGALNAGYHTVNFNATNLSTGVYFYRIEAGSFVSVKKLMLLK